ncbi:hypothetical protein DB30_08061 [Enhygromyxa salina]|uniref:Uncharacterized protein n=1 Tax=Enhygromyxa salina TaxID=215803 RepID=A0A0C1Z719_9BACT|nr:hypothetical protein DB30_08061 [Enhygromyxa salina]
MHPALARERGAVSGANVGTIVRRRHRRRQYPIPPHGP